MTDFKLSDFLKNREVTEQTLKLYLCREEFSHITIRKVLKVPYLLNVTPNDVLRLKELFSRSRRKRTKF